MLGFCGSIYLFRFFCLSVVVACGEYTAVMQRSLISELFGVSCFGVGIVWVCLADCGSFFVCESFSLTVVFCILYGAVWP